VRKCQGEKQKGAENTQRVPYNQHHPIKPIKGGGAEGNEREDIKKDGSLWPIRRNLYSFTRFPLKIGAEDSKQRGNVGRIGEESEPENARGGGEAAPSTPDEEG